MLPPQLQHHPLDRLRRLVRTRSRPRRPIRQTADPTRQIPANQVCTDCRDTPTCAATSVTDAPANTARTASNRCSTTDNATRAIPGLPSQTTSRNIADHEAAITTQFQAPTDTALSSTYRHRTCACALALLNLPLRRSRRLAPLACCGPCPRSLSLAAGRSSHHCVRRAESRLPQPARHCPCRRLGTVRRTV